ncbi:uncharacterized protein EV420DRAFT_1546568 [Desarmillaria tabescens]|uniref:Uncharacterized protein n=1 Tax=Armillaria tabescens TaxID=1929756 RepID=A0AA39KBM4_ARMTA|nr:uncharacterized protein EV420DRAFT_1546568 [Desarmillaria tabescens]KAK0458110.1 hypothetical protein EV420DRAFT_1546568 [Desarmillaria tabescens]
MLPSPRYSTPATGAPFETWKRRTRRPALVGNRIVNPWLPPRRVWDLYSNRVVPWWITDVDGKLRWPQPISHAWVDEKDRADRWVDQGRMCVRRSGSWTCP